MQKTTILQNIQIAAREGKQPERPFHFEPKRVDGTLSRLCSDIISLNVNRTLSSLRALFWFAEYLHAHRAIPEKEVRDLQEQCVQLHESVFPRFKLDIVAQSFGDFPL